MPPPIPLSQPDITQDEIDAVVDVLHSSTLTIGPRLEQFERTIAKLSDTLFRLTAAESNWRWLHDNAAGFSVTIEDVSEELGALSLQGPKSRALLERLTGADLSQLKYHRFTHAPILGESTRRALGAANAWLATDTQP